MPENVPKVGNDILYRLGVTAKAHQRVRDAPPPPPPSQ